MTSSFVLLALVGTSISKTVNYTVQKTSRVANAEEIIEETSIEIKKEIPKYTCVKWLRERVPSLPRGDAKDLIPNSDFPRVGWVVKIDYPQGHVGQVIEVTSTGISVRHFIDGSERVDFYSFDSGKILGYWYLDS